MKARAIRKRMMPHRGVRLPFTVTLPLSAFPVPCPPFEAPGKVIDHDQWLVREGDELREWLIMCAYTTDPGVDSCGVLVQMDDRWCEYRGGSWPVGRLLGQSERRDIPREVVEAWAKRETWAEKWLYADGRGGGDCAATTVLTHAKLWPRSIWHEFDGDRVRVTYSVKPWHVRHFARDMAAAFKMARRAGLDLRWVKEGR